MDSTITRFMTILPIKTILTQHHIYSPLQTDDGIEHKRFLTDKEYFKTIVAQIKKYLKTP